MSSNPSASGSSLEIVPTAKNPTIVTTHQSLPTNETTATYPGFLSYPDNITTAFPLPSDATAVSASATWQGGGPLNLAIECPSNVNHSTGYLYTVSIAGELHGSPCQLVLTEQGILTQPVPYSLDITVTTSA